MDYKGYCFWASDIPSPSVPHYIIITSSIAPDNTVMYVVVSSIKYKPDGTTKFYDKSCILNIGDIVDDSGKNIITKPSFIRYGYTDIINVKYIFNNQFTKKFCYKCKISNKLLKRIQDGAKQSPELQEEFKQYFKYF